LKPRLVSQRSGHAPPGAGGDDLALEARPDQQRDPATVVEVGVGQEQEVDLRRVEAEGSGILLGDLAPPDTFRSRPGS